MVRLCAALSFLYLAWGFGFVLTGLVSGALECEDTEVTYRRNGRGILEVKLTKEYLKDTTCLIKPGPLPRTTITL